MNKKTRKPRYSQKRADAARAEREADTRRFCQFCFVELVRGDTYEFRCPECGEEFDKFWALTFDQMKKDRARLLRTERRTRVEPCPNSYIHTLNKHRHTAHDIIVTPTRVTGPWREVMRQEAPGAQRVPDILHVGDLCKSNYTDTVYRIIGIHQATECTCTESFCANRIGENHPLASPTTEHCHKLYCWSLSLATPDARIRRDGRANEHDAGAGINGLVAEDGRILQLYCNNDDEVFFVPAEKRLPALQLEMF